MVEAVAQGMHEEDARESPQARVVGIGYLVGQPEFGQSATLPHLVGMLEDPKAVVALIPSTVYEEGFTVVIGREHKEEALRQCSVVVARYGAGEGSTGVVGVVGPTRMPYSRVMAGARFFASIMSGFLGDILGKRPQSN